MPHQYVQPSRFRQILRRLLLIALARTPLGRLLGRVRPLRRWLEARALARTDDVGLHIGVFASHAEAQAAIPPSRLAGWDHEDSATLWVDQIDPVRPSTYPVFFWLAKRYGAGQRLVDFGGSIGLTYYGYRRYSPMPAGASWTVVEVPALAAQGRVIAAREQAPGLGFEDDLKHAPAADLFLSAGALQYVPLPLPELLGQLARPPQLVILNKLPVADAPECWTLQNYGPAVSAMRIFDRRALLAHFEQAGYRLLDRWAVQDLDVQIPFHPERYLREFEGFVFERIA